MRNDELVYAVKRALLRDPKIDAEAVAVCAEDGHIRLRGTVGSLRQKREAQRAATRVYGVESVQNDLQATPLCESAREDADLRGEVLQLLGLHCFVPPTVDATVWDRVVTLTGDVEWEYQRTAAEVVAGNAIGIGRVVNKISPKRDPHCQWRLADAQAGRGRA